MRHLLAVAALTVSASALAQETSENFQLNTTADLLAVCSTSESESLNANAKGFCHGFLTGSYRYYLLVVPPDRRFVCEPDPLPTRGQVMDGFVSWARKHPVYMRDAPVDSLFRFLEQTYPCQK